MKKLLDYDDVTVIPNKLSTVNSRSHVDTSINAFGIATLDVPILAAPMADVCDVKTSYTLYTAGALGVIHRFGDCGTQIDLINEYFNTPESRGKYACSVALGDMRSVDRYALEADCKIFCIDTANGYNKNVGNFVRQIRENVKGWVIAGNVASYEGFKYLSESGAHAVRVGIGGGAACTTRYETGIYAPMISLISDIYARSVVDGLDALIIADGGIKNPGDMCKALLAGADLVMMGRAFAGASDSPANFIDNNNFTKKYRGSASGYFSKSNRIEGTSIEVTEGGTVADVIKRYKHGLQSSMSYMGAHSLVEYFVNSSLHNLE